LSENKTVKIGFIDISPAPLAPPVAVVAQFDAAPRNGNVSLNVSFTDLSTGSPDSWNWSWGDNTWTNGTTQNPFHVYSAAGTYSITLIANSTTSSDSITKTDFIYVSETPITEIAAQFDASPRIGNVSLNVSFTDLSTGSPTSWNWTFGDGNYSEAQNPFHNYEVAGTYNITLTANSTTSTDTITKTNFVVISEAPVVPGAQVVAQFDASPRIGNVSLNVSFTDLSTGSPTSWNWTFGDGNYSEAQNPFHNYEVAGTYNITLTANSTTSTDTITKTNFVVISEAPVVPGAQVVAQFDASPRIGNVTTNVSFTDLSTGYPDSWNWSFGDGNYSEAQNPFHNYEIAGIFTVNLTANSTLSENKTVKIGFIDISPAPLAPPVAVVAQFDASPRNGNVSLNVSFTDLSTGSPDSWNWSFGDNTYSEDQNPFHIYGTAGTYNIVLIANSTASTDTITKAGFIQVNAYVPPPVIAQFDAAPRVGNVSMNVSFTDLSTGSPTSWNWSFGDGNYSEAQNPFHNYEVAGTYNIVLTANSTTSIDTDTKTNFIYVSETPITQVVAQFDANPRTGIRPSLVSFTDLSTGSPTSWNWSFGDGSYSESQNPAHIYTEVGNYTISLTANTTSHSNTATKVEFVVIGEPVYSGYTANVTSGTVPLAVQFNDTSINATSWGWSFGDGNTSTSQNVTFVYNIAGTYQVIHVAANAYGYNTTTGIIVVSEPVTPPAPTFVAQFVGSPTSGNNSLLVGFTDLTSGTPTAWCWTFGDGNYSNLQNPVHRYEIVGAFTVTLNASKAGVYDVATKKDYINVTPGLAPSPLIELQAQFAGVPTGGISPLTVYFSDVSAGSPTGWNWSFGDGALSTLQNPSHQYNNAGTYSVVLNITNGTAYCETQKLNYVVVTNATSNLQAQFVGSPMNGANPLTVGFTDLSTGSPTGWNWSFGDGNWSNGTSQNPSHQYNMTGTFTVILTVSTPTENSTLQKTGYVIVTAGGATPTPTPTPVPTITIPPEPLAAQGVRAEVGETWIKWSWTWNSSNMTASIYIDGEKVENTTGNQILISNLDPRSAHTMEIYTSNGTATGFVTKKDVTTLPSTFDIEIYFVISMVITLFGLFVMRDPHLKIIFSVLGLVVALYTLNMAYGFWLFLPLIPAILAGIVIIYNIREAVNGSNIGRW
jgi:PKD repeat protein